MTDQATRVDPPARGRPGQVKCLIWDLDGTLWDGVLLEGGATALRPHVREVLRALDERGILHSIASRNDPATALARLESFGVAEYFLHPQIGWGAKSDAVARIAARLNLGIDAMAFVDDQPFELDEVNFAHPQVLGVAAAELPGLCDRPEFTPRFVTDESRLRRLMYRSSIERDTAEQEHDGTSQEFLATLGMVFEIREASQEDLRRAEELTVRTHQLNSTGVTYSFDELAELTASPRHLVLVARLVDRYGSYGMIGLAVVELGAAPGASGPPAAGQPPAWRLRLLLMSCRVMSRGVGTILLNQVMRRARDAGADLHADFLPTDRNRIMHVTYRFAGFTELEASPPPGPGATLTLVAPRGPVPDPPGYVQVIA